MIVQVTDRETAISALQQVSEQGEGFESPGDDESHFLDLREVTVSSPRSTHAQRAALVRDLAPNPTAHLDGEDVAIKSERTRTSTSAISHPEARLWAHLFNVRYRKLLVGLAHAFDWPPEPGHRRHGPARLAYPSHFAEMYNLRAIAGVLVTLPLDHADPGGERAGPPFQMPYTLMLAHDEADRWRVHRDLLDASATLVARIRTGSGAGQPYIVALAQADEIERGQVDLLIGATAP